MPTLTIDNFAGRLTRQDNGSLNSGFVKLTTSNGYDPFGDPGSLQWFETPIQIDSAGSVITDMIVAGKVRVESGITYVYAIGHLARLYKIQVNDPATNNPDFDSPVLLATLTSQSPTFTRGGSMDFFGSTERIYIGHDKGVTRIDFAGTNETFVGTLSSYTATVPRPFRQFIGKLYFGNGSNIGEIDSTATVTSYVKLSPGFPDNTQVRDLDTSSDGNYFEIVVNRLPLGDITATTVNTTDIANVESYIFKWNGTDIGYTSFNSFPSFNLTANQNFGNYQYLFGYDLSGTVVFDSQKKILSTTLSQSPLPNAVSSAGNIIGWLSPEYSFASFSLKLSSFLYGPLDIEYLDNSWYRNMQMSATGSETDVIRAPFEIIVSSLNFGASNSGYTLNKIGSGKVYFSTLETSAAPTTKYKFYKFQLVPFGFGTSMAGVYETQTQLFSKKIVVKEVRIYGEPWVASNAFTIALIGSSGSPITNSSKTFTAGSTLTIGDDMSQYNPAHAPTYALGVRITNAGTVNHTIAKIEIDYEQAGKK